MNAFNNPYAGGPQRQAWRDGWYNEDFAADKYTGDVDRDRAAWQAGRDAWCRWAAGEVR